MRLLQTMFRLVNGVRKVGAGLRPFNESVWPGVRNDLFVAHESIYVFFSTFVQGRRVLDGGCGTGYGTHRLASSGARSATGVDLDGKTIAYARNHFRAPNLTFEVADLEALSYPDGSFDLVVASNSLEHLDDPKAFLVALRRMLTNDGLALLAIPPIYSDADVEVHKHIHYHRNQLHVDQWIQLLEEQGFCVKCLSLRASPGSAQPDFHSHLPSRLTTDDFLVVEVSRQQLLAVSSIGVIFECSLLRTTDC